MISATGRTTLVWIGVAIYGLMLAAIAMFGLHVYRGAEGFDRQALERDRAAFRQGVYLLGEFSAVEQLSLAEWTEAYRNISARFDRGWVTDNLGPEVFSDTAEEEVLLMASDGAVLYSSRRAHGEPLKDATITTARRVAAQARTALEKAARVDPQGRFNQLDLPLDGALFEGVYAHGLAVIDGVVTVAAGAVVLPDRGDMTRLPDTPVVLVNIRPIRDTMRVALGGTTQLGQIRFVRDRPADPAEWSTRLDNRLGDGDSEVFAVWPKRSLAANVLGSMLPSLVLSACILLVLTAGAIILLRRQAACLADSEARAWHAARHDPATGLANRTWFRERLDGLLSAPMGDGEILAVALIDIDYFKPVNDTLGHAAGDAVILAVAERILDADPSVVLGARLGGDEFVAVSRVSGGDGPSDFAGILHAALCRPVRFASHDIPVSTSVGVTPALSGADIEQLLSRADLALYRAKADGRGCFRIYDPDLDRPAEPSSDDAMSSVDALRRKAEELRGADSANKADAKATA